MQESPEYYYIEPQKMVFTTSSGKPELYKDNNNQYCMKWNSGCFAPAWIQIQFEPEFITQLCLIPNMTPPTGDVTYNILIDGRMRIDLDEKLTNQVLKVIKLDCKCSTIRVTTTKSPSWIAWFNIWPRRNGYYG